MYHRQTTPNAPTYAYTPASGHSRYPSDSSNFSCDDSPNSVFSSVTPITPPPRSPVRQYGQMILPKLRDQDQVTEPSTGPVRYAHRRTISTNSVHSYHPYKTSRPTSLIRRDTSPAEHSNLATPSSVHSPFDAGFHSALNSPMEFGPALDRRGSVGYSRALPVAPSHSHRRSGSASSLDESVLDRYGYPTYRRMPNYVSSNNNNQVPSLNVVTTMAPTYSPGQQNMDFDGSQDYQVSDLSPAPAVQYPAPAVPESGSFTSDTAYTTTLLDYLAAPNPAPQLVRRIMSAGRGTGNSHFWWDVRNLRSWTDFSIAKISEFEGLLPLLQVPVSTALLPTPARGNMMPDSELALHDVWRDHFTTKVNAALQVSLPEPHMVMRSCRPLPGSRQPDFVSNYSNDYEKTLAGDVRGRVVGLVKAYDQWNTGMRSEAPNKQVYYLQGLAHLHRVMREHGCRYGFIMNEIELLCVRCGGPPSAVQTDISTVNSTGSVPLFGYLELSSAIRMSTQGVSAETGAPQMTAALALWYLHMLAKESPLPGTMSWRMEVGGPSALTRQNIIERDTWVPKPNMSEKREAKRLRGWVWPEEPWSRKESGKPKRAKKV